MKGIIFGVMISIIAIIFVIAISVKELNRIKKRKFICEKCGKEFFQRYLYLHCLISAITVKL